MLLILIIPYFLNNCIPPYLVMKICKNTNKPVHLEVLKARFSYRKHWEIQHPKEVTCGMFCKLCQQASNPPPFARVVTWMSRGINDWNHASELLKLHSVYLALEMPRCIAGWLRKMYCRCIVEIWPNNWKRGRKEIEVFCLNLFDMKESYSYTTHFNQLLDLQVASGDLIME